MKRKLALLLTVILLATSIVPLFIFEAAAANAAPTVIPAIRSWNGGSGKFTPNASTILVYNGSEASEQIKLVQEFFTDMLGITPAIKTSGTSNAIIFKIDASACNGEEEGYEIVATTSSVTIKASTKIGLLYGGITVVQSCYADGYFPVGTAKDWPEYPVRSGMLDVARQYIPMTELYEVTKYMAWYKLNEFHVHLNDNGKNDYIAFRLECETYPELTSKDGHYTKAEYKQYQRDMAKYGITIISEIDSPYHSDCFRTIEGVKFIEKATLDLSDPTTIQIMKNIWNEYTGGSDPVFVKKASGETVVHIGMDEYPIARKSEIIAYAQQIINLVNANGYTARFWSGAGVSSDGVGGDGCLGGAKFTGKFQTNYWDFNMSGITETAAMGCPVVNNFSAHLYVVPGSDETGIDGFENKLTKQMLNAIWNERNWEVSVGRWNGQTVLPANDPKLLGASFAIWNDWGSAWFGLTYRDIIDRFSLSACFIAEKTWGGSTTAFADFYSDYEKLGFRVGSADPFGKKAYDNGDIKVDFSATFPKTYTAASVVNGEYVLNGTNPFSLGEGFAGFPNTLSFDITLDELPAKRTAIFAGYDTVGTDIYVDSDGTLGIKSKINEDANEAKAAYFFSYDYKLTAGVKTNVKFTCDGTVTTLIINNGFAFAPINSRQSEAYFGSQASPLTDPTAVPDTTLFATLTIPLSKVGAGLKGKIDSIIITNKASEVPKAETVNHLAVNKKVTDSSGKDPLVSSSSGFVFGDVLTDGVAQPAVNPLNGSWFCFQKWWNADNGSQNGKGEVIVDLGEIKMVDSVKLHLANTMAKFGSSECSAPAPLRVEAYLSENGTSYTSIGTFTVKTDKEIVYWTEKALATSTKARYIKLQVDIDVAKGSYALIDEIAVYGSAVPEVVDHIAVGKPTTVSGNFKGITTSAGIVIGAPSVLTDGNAAGAHDSKSGNWMLYQTWLNSTTGTSAWGNIFEAIIDLQGNYTIDNIKVHLANSDNKAGTTFTGKYNAPQSVEAFVLVNDKWESIGKFAINTTDGVYWTTVTAPENTVASQIKIVTILAGTAGEGAIWGGLMDEIAVYGEKYEGTNPPVDPPIDPPVDPDKPVEEKVEHIAVGKPTSVSGKFNGLTTSAGIVIGAPSILTDGSTYSLHDSVSGNWMLYQTWLNSVAGNGAWGNNFEVVIDLQGEYVIDSVKVHLANSQNYAGTTFAGVYDAPQSVEAFAMVDGAWKSLGKFEINTTDATYWAEVVLNEDVVLVATQIKIVTVLPTGENLLGWGGLMDEIAVYGEEYIEGPTMVDRLLGDVNNDGVVDKKDYAALKRYCFETMQLDEAAMLAADVNQDGEVDKKDYAALKRFCFDTMVIEPEYIQVPVVAE